LANTISEKNDGQGNGGGGGGHDHRIENGHSGFVVGAVAQGKTYEIGPRPVNHHFHANEYGHGVFSRKRQSQSYRKQRRTGINPHCRKFNAKVLLPSLEKNKKKNRGAEHIPRTDDDEATRFFPPPNVTFGG
jgi:hypothetical protein